MGKLEFKDYIEDTKIKYDNKVVVSYYEGDVEVKTTYEYVRVLKIYDDCINIDNQTIKLNKIKDMNIKIDGTVEKIVVESEKSMVDFEKCKIGSIETKKLDCGDLSNVDCIIVENNIKCGDITKVGDLRSENGNISCGDIISDKISTSTINCGDIESKQINVLSGKNVEGLVEISCADIGGNLSVSGNPNINCADIGGNVNIDGEGNVNCADINGNLTTGTTGDVSCGDIYGDMINKK